MRENTANTIINSPNKEHARKASSKNFSDDCEVIDAIVKTTESTAENRPTISTLLDTLAFTDRVPNVGVRGRFPGRRKQEAVIA